MYRRPCRSSIQIPSAWRIADRHGVDTDCRRKTWASRWTRARVCSSSWVLDQAQRRGERLVSPSASASVFLGIIVYSFRPMRWPRMVNPQSHRTKINLGSLSSEVDHGLEHEQGP